MFRRLAKQALKKATSNQYIPLNWVELNRERLRHNLDVVQRQQATMNIFPVLKGNAYGHGLEEVATILNDANVAMIAVDGYFEAAKIRDISKHPLLVMGYVLPNNVGLLDTKRCSFVVQDSAGLRAFASLQQPVKIHLELNTGMNRLGLAPEELEAYLEMLRMYPRLELEGVMTHLADADNAKSNVFTDQQTKKFDTQVGQLLAAGFKPKYIHIAQTAGSPKARSQYANTLRIGIGAYGINPLQIDDMHSKDLDELQPVLELKSTIIKIIELQKHDKVGYNGMFVATQPMRVAVLPLGYYEGVPRALSNQGFVTHENRQLPIVGRICMNHTMVDVTDTNLRLGDHVTIISHNPAEPNSVVGMQQAYGLFSYNTLTGITPHMKRLII